MGNSRSSGEFGDQTACSSWWKICRRSPFYKTGRNSIVHVLSTEFSALSCWIICVLSCHMIYITNQPRWFLLKVQILLILSIKDGDYIDFKLPRMLSLSLWSLLLRRFLFCFMCNNSIELHSWITLKSQIFKPQKKDTLVFIKINCCYVYMWIYLVYSWINLILF